MVEAMIATDTALVVVVAVVAIVVAVLKVVLLLVRGVVERSPPVEYAVAVEGLALGQGAMQQVVSDPDLAGLVMPHTMLMLQLLLQ